MGVVNKINKLLQTKAAIRQAIIGKGVEVPEDTVFADYPAKINAIESGSGGDNAQYKYWWNVITNNGADYSYLFDNSNLTTLDLSNLDTSNATDMKNMFYNCDNLTSLDVSNFNTSKVTSMTYMFGLCNSLTLLEGLNNFNTSNVTDMSHMFAGCHSLETLDLSSFDTSNVTDMKDMFYNCDNLTSLDVSSFDTSKVTNMSYIFQYCDKLTSLDLSNWDISKITASYAASNAFNCPALTDFKAPKNISVAFNFSFCPNLTHDSLMSIINNLATVTSTTKLTLGTTNLAKLTDDELAIAVNRGWTLV